MSRVIAVLDSEVFIGANFNLQTPELRKLTRAAAGTDLRLAIPEVVVREVERKYGDLLGERITDFKRAYRKLDKQFLSLELTIPSGSDVKAATESFAQEFAEWRRERECIETKIESVSAGKLVDRDLARRKPFKKSGEGMRDALVWETVLLLAGESQARVVLISGNKKDFGDESGEALNAELKREAEGLLESSTAEYCPSLRVFSAQNIDPNLTLIALAEVEELRAEEFQPQDVFENNQEEIRGEIERALEISFTPDFQSPTVDYFDGGESIVIAAEEIDDKEIQVTLEASSSVLIDGYAFKSDVDPLVEAYGASIAEWDHNEHLAWLQLEDNITVRVTVSLNALNYEQTAFQVNQLSWGYLAEYL